MSGFNQDRVNKISQIMPQFAKVAQPGDTVLMGLEGDPIFPYEAEGKRPSATIRDVNHRTNDTLVTLQLDDGSQKEVSSMSLAADQVWEYDDTTFRNVIERQQGGSKPYRGVTNDNSEVSQLRAEVETLKMALEMERENTRNFHNTMIASMNEIASDVCKLDTSGKNTEFCKVLKSEYNHMMQARAETTLPAENDPKTYRGIEDDISDTDFF